MRKANCSKFRMQSLLQHLNESCFLDLFTVCDWEDLLPIQELGNLN